MDFSCEDFVSSKSLESKTNFIDYEESLLWSVLSFEKLPSATLFKGYPKIGILGDIYFLLYKVSSPDSLISLY